MSTHKLLLADDSKTIQKVISLTFADAGFEVTSVGDGDSAMEKLAEFTPDLVMADVKMPGLNGYEVCERIKQDAATRHIPVILLVGAFEPFDADEAKRVGAADHLTKPFQSIQALSAKVNDLINSDRNESETADVSFDKTLEFEKVPPENLSDAGMDDAMITADAYAGDDEAQTSERDGLMELDEANLLELPPRDYFLSTITNDPFPQAEMDSMPEAFEAEASAEEAGDAEPVETEESEVADEASAEETGEAEPVETEESEVLDEAPVEEPDDAEPVETEEAEVSDETAQAANLSPELIDAIAAKVVEKISDQVIREIAWEVVPQMTDLIVKRLAEEKAEETRKNQ